MTPADMPLYWYNFIKARPHPFYLSRAMADGVVMVALLDDVGDVVVSGSGTDTDAACWAAWMKVPEHVRERVSS